MFDLKVIRADLAQKIDVIIELIPGYHSQREKVVGELEELQKILKKLPSRKQIRKCWSCVFGRIEYGLPLPRMSNWVRQINKILEEGKTLLSDSKRDS